jgi:hypothetical protein
LFLAKPAFDPLLAAVPDDADDADEEDLLLLTQRTQRARELLISLDCSQPRQYSFRSRYWVKPRQPSFFHHAVERYYEEVDWLTHYRIDKDTFYELLAAVTHHIEKQDTRYRLAVSPGQRLSCMLLYLATGSCMLLYLATGITMQQVASMEGISISTVQCCMHECARALNDRLGQSLWFLGFSHAWRGIHTHADRVDTS